METQVLALNRESTKQCRAQGVSTSVTPNSMANDEMAKAAWQDLPHCDSTLLPATQIALHQTASFPWAVTFFSQAEVLHKSDRHRHAAARCDDYCGFPPAESMQWAPSHESPHSDRYHGR